MAAQIASGLASPDADVVRKSVDVLYMIVKEGSPPGVFTLDSSTSQLLAVGLLNVIRSTECSIPTVCRAFDCLLDSSLECTWSYVLPLVSNALFKLCLDKRDFPVPSNRVIALIERLLSTRFSEWSTETWISIALVSLKLSLDHETFARNAGLKFMRCIASKSSFSNDMRFFEAAAVVLESSASLPSVEQGLHLIAVCSCLLQSYFNSPSLYGKAIVTSFANIMAPIFGSTDRRLRIAAFCLWDELVQAIGRTENGIRHAEIVQQLTMPYIQVKFDGRNDRLIKLKSWWNLLLNFHEHLEDYFKSVCCPFLKFCLEAEDSRTSATDYPSSGTNCQDVTVEYLREVLANFLLINPSGYFDFPRLAPLPVPCFSKISTVADHADIILEALLSIAPICYDGQKEFASACWVAIFDCIGATRGVIAEGRHHALCEQCAIFFGQFLQECRIGTDEVTVLLTLLSPRYIHFPPLQLPLIGESQLTVSLAGLYFISIVLSKDRSSSADSIGKRKLRSWLNTNLDQLVKFIALDDCAARLLACFYEEAVILLSGDYCYALYFAWRSIVASLLQNWDKLEKEAAPKLSLWLSYVFKHAPYLKQQVELRHIFTHWALLLDKCPPTSFEMLCIQLIDMAGFSSKCKFFHQSGTFFYCCAKMLCILLSKLSPHGKDAMNWPSPKIPAKTLRQECGHALLHFYRLLVRVFATELHENRHFFSASDETTVITFFQFVRDACLTIRSPDEVVAVSKYLIAPITQLVAISDSLVQFSKRSLLEQVRFYIRFYLGTVKKFYRGPYDSSFVQIIAQLLTALLCHKHMNMRRLAHRFWQQTCADCTLTPPCLQQLREALERSVSPINLSDGSPEIEWSASAASDSVPCISEELSSPLNMNTPEASTLSKKRLKNAQNISSKRQNVVSGNARDRPIGIRKQLFPGKDLGENSPVFIALPSPEKLPLISRKPCVSIASPEGRRSAPLSAMTPSDEDILNSNIKTILNADEISEHLLQHLPSSTGIDTQASDIRNGLKFHLSNCKDQVCSEIVQISSRPSGQVPDSPSCSHSPSYRDHDVDPPASSSLFQELVGPTVDLPSSSSGLFAGTVDSITAAVKYGNCGTAEPLFRELINCTEPVDILAPFLTSSVSCPGLRKVFNDCGIYTIGDFARLPVHAVQEFPIKEPKVSLAKRVLRRLHTSSNGLLRFSDLTALKHQVGMLSMLSRYNANSPDRLDYAAIARSNGSAESPAEDAVRSTTVTCDPPILASDAIECLRGAIGDASNMLEHCQKEQSVVMLLSVAEILESSAKDLIKAVKCHFAKRP